MSDSVKGEIVSAVVELSNMGSTNPDMRRTGSNLAYSSAVLTGLVKTVLMPLALANAHAQAYFEKHFPQQLGDKMADVPVESVLPPKASVAGPVLHALGYSHEESELRELYLSLLATAMDSRVAGTAHPGFAAIIGTLSAEEVPFLERVLRSEVLPCAELRIATEGEEGWSPRYRHLLPFLTADNETQITNLMFSAYVDNWVRLGLVTVDYSTFMTAPGAYDWVTERVEYKETIAKESETLEFAKGVLQGTSYGVEFGKAVGIIDRVTSDAALLE